MVPELTVAERARVLLKKGIALLFRLCGGFRLYCRFAKPSVTIVVYHRIMEDGHRGIAPYISVRAGALRRQLELFRRHYAVISMEEAVSRLRRNQVDRRYLVVTFDDGYRDLATLGSALFRDTGVQPMVFLATGCIEEGRNLWPDVVRSLVSAVDSSFDLRVGDVTVRIHPGTLSRIKAVEAIIAHLKGLGVNARTAFLNAFRDRLHRRIDSGRLMLTWDEARCLKSAGISLGSHTVNHPVLSQLDEKAMEREIRESKLAIEARCGTTVTVFAYPNGITGDFNAATVRQLQTAGYEAAVTTNRGHNRPGDDLYALKRTGIYLTDSLDDVKLKLALEDLW